MPLVKGCASSEWEATGAGVISHDTKFEAHSSILFKPDCLLSVASMMGDVVCCMRGTMILLGSRTEKDISTEGEG